MNKLHIFYVEDEPELKTINGLFDPFLASRQKSIQDTEELLDNLRRGYIEIDHALTFSEALKKIRSDTLYHMAVLDIKLIAYLRYDREVFEDYREKIGDRFLEVEENKLIYGGMFLWAEILKNHPQTRVILYTAHGGIIKVFAPFMVYDNISPRLLQKTDTAGIKKAIVEGITTI